MNPSIRNPKSAIAFSLIELLVVVAIIALLISLLAPAMDRAVYRAELAMCGTRLKGIANSADVYALDYKRHYPNRAAVVANLNPHYLSNGGAVDDRRLLRPYLPVNKLLQDPLSGAVDLERTLAGTNVYSAYNMWFGMDFKTPGEKAMRKLGDTLTWTNFESGQPVQYRLRFLAGDRDRYLGANVTDGQHPDCGDVLLLRKLQDQEFDTGNAANDARENRTFTFSRWESYVTSNRGLVEMNFAFDDGAAIRYNAVEFNEWVTGERMVRVPAFAGAANWSAGWYEQAPKQ